MIEPKSDLVCWVCRACQKQDHRNCEGTLEDPEKIVNFCECGVCKRRFERNVNKVLRASSRSGGSIKNQFSAGKLGSESESGKER